MDVFVEKIVSKRKTVYDFLFMGTLCTAWLFLAIFLAFNLRMGLMLNLILLFGVYHLIKGRNIEYEYAVTNGDLDIDKIIAQRKRKRIFSANCNNFEIIARITDGKYNEVKNIENRIEAISSKDSPDIYFIVLRYKEQRTLVLFEPDERMIKIFKTYVPRKVFE